MKVGLKMQNITYIIDKLRNHIHKIIVIHWISYEPFEQPGHDLQSTDTLIEGVDESQTEVNPVSNLLNQSDLICLCSATHPCVMC